MPIYEFKHPKTGEIFEDIRTFSEMNKDFIAPDGVKCDRIVSSSIGYVGLSESNREVFQIDRDEVRKNNPRFIKYRDGHREFYNANKHC